jgi:hypothetical protein
MNEWMGFLLDGALILVVGAGVVQATRLIMQLQDLRASRAEMERFVRDFNGAITRAEAGIKTLKATARDSGDDLEKLVEKANSVRDELNFIIESADSMAERLSAAASVAKQSGSASAEKASVEQRVSPKPTIIASASAPKGERATISRAEQELMQALKKMG